MKSLIKPKTVHVRRVVTMQHCYKIWVALSELAIKKLRAVPLAEKSRWRHIWLEIKLRNLGNHAPQIKSFYKTLLGSHGRSFRIRPKNVRAASPGRGLTMTSYPVCNKTSLSRTPCIADKKLLWNAIMKSWSLFQNPSCKIAWSASWRRNHDDVISGLQ